MASEYLEKERIKYRSLKEQSKLQPLSDEELAQRLPELRTQDDNRIRLAASVPEDICIEQCTIGGRTGEYYRVKDGIPGKIILYLHGGAWENGSVVSRRFVAMNLAEAAQVDCFSADYTQWPEGHFEQGLSECLNMYRSLLAMGYDNELIALAGESAGASMALSLVLSLKEQGMPLPGYVVAYCPVTDLEDTFPSRRLRDNMDPMISPDVGRTMLRHYCGGKGAADPIRCTRHGDFHRFPPTFIGVGTDEVLYDDSVDLHNKLDACGVPNKLVVYEGLFHAFMMMPCPEAIVCIRQTADFLFN